MAVCVQVDMYTWVYILPEIPTCLFPYEQRLSREEDLFLLTGEAPAPQIKALRAVLVGPGAWRLQFV